MRDSGAGDFRRRPVGHRLAVDSDGAVGGAPESGHDLGELALPIAGDARDSERFARADLQIDIPQRRQSFFAEGADAAQLQDGLPGHHGLMRFVGWMLDQLGQLAPDHEPRQCAAVGFSGCGRRDDLTPAQDADPVRDLHYLVELVRDEDDAEALPRHAAERLHQTPRLLRRENGGRLVQNEDPRAEIEQTQDLHSLLLADGELPDLCARIDAETVALAQLR